MSGTTWSIHLMAERPGWPDCLSKRMRVCVRAEDVEDWVGGGNDAYLVVNDVRTELGLEEVALIHELVLSMKAIRHMAGREGLEV
jgi:hypothetical protein